MATTTNADAYRASLELARDEDGVVAVAATTGDGDFVLRAIDADDSPTMVVLLSLTGHEVTAISPGVPVRSVGTHSTVAPLASSVTTKPSTTMIGGSATTGGSGGLTANNAGDPFRWQQWALGGTDFDRLWDDKNSGGGVTVAVIDTGVDATNPDLVERVVIGTDLVTVGAAGEDVPAADMSAVDGTDDQNGHGTHVAGIIAAERDNGFGIVGVAPQASIMPIRALDGEGHGLTTNVALGVDWAVAHGADVINLSLAGGDDPVLEQAITNAVDQGVVVIAAAGNAGVGMDNNAFCDVDAYPAAYPDVVAVAALDQGAVVAPFSLQRRYVDIAAPGASIISTWPMALTSGGSVPFAYSSGTSMAAPYVSGIAALMRAQRPGASVDSLRSALLSSAVPTAGATARDLGWGCGRIDPVAAILSIEGRGTANGIPGCGAAGPSNG